MLTVFKGRKKRQKLPTQNLVPSENFLQQKWENFPRKTILGEFVVSSLFFQEIFKEAFKTKGQ
jgi:hypothetical protein